MRKAAAEQTRVAVISGGSSGIGLACARSLLDRGYKVVLLARDETRLTEAAVGLSGAGLSRVETMSVDVTDAQACAAALADIQQRHGRLDWLITSAGIVEPGLFVDVDLPSHRRQMDTNFFGTLGLAHPAARLMCAQRSGRITLISSAAAFVGVVGYSGYTPGKFAVRGLGEVLRVELAPFGVSVSVAFPPDTDTPQLAAENLTKPEATRRITAGGGVWPADVIAERIVQQAERGAFMLAPTRLMQAFGWAHSFYAPIFRWRQSRLMTKFGLSVTQAHK